MFWSKWSAGGRAGAHPGWPGGFIAASVGLAMASVEPAHGGDHHHGSMEIFYILSGTLGHTVSLSVMS